MAERRRKKGGVCTHAYSIHMSICICLYLGICTRPIHMSVNICMHMSVRSVARMHAAHMRSAHTCTCMRAHVHARTHARSRARLRAGAGAHALMHVRARARAGMRCVAPVQRTRTCASNVQGRARATYKDVRELVPSWVPKALVRWHVTGQSRHARDTGHPAGCRRPAVAPCDAVGTGFRAGKWPKKH